MKKILFSICLFFIFTLSACSSDELADGEYKVNILLEGGSGKASLTSPTDMIVENRTAYVSIEWSSPNYDYMIVDGKKYEPVNDYGNSVFEIKLPEYIRNIEITNSSLVYGEGLEISNVEGFEKDGRIYYL